VNILTVYCLNLLQKMMFEEYARVEAAAIGSGGDGGGDVGKLS
jgi:hypothetical protein